MGRSAKRYISIVTVLMVMFMPMSTAYAAIGSLFSNNALSHASSDSQIIVELATEYTHSHDGLSLVVDGEMTDLDESIVNEILSADGSHENQGSGGVSASIYMQTISDRTDWNHVYLDDHVRYDLTSVPLPAEIRPPIYL